MYANHTAIQNYQISTIPHYINTSKSCLNNLISGIVKCVPLMTAFITIGTLFSLIQEVHSRYIPYAETARTSTEVFMPDDVKIVPIWEATWLHVVNTPQVVTPKKCMWNNFFCARSF